MRCRSEFGPEFSVPVDLLNYLLALGSGWEDTSWHNDSCPTFVHEELGLRLWVDAEKDADREWNGMSRFAVSETDEEGSENEPLLRTDSVNEVLTFLQQMSKE